MKKVADFMGSPIFVGEEKSVIVLSPEQWHVMEEAMKRFLSGMLQQDIMHTVPEVEIISDDPQQEYEIYSSWGIGPECGFKNLDEALDYVKKRGHKDLENVGIKCPDGSWYYWLEDE